MATVSTADHSDQPLFTKWKSPTDWPWTVAYCVGEARRIISYHEHLPTSQRPPASIWHSRRKCAEWIEDHAPGKDGTSSNGSIWFNDSEVEH